MTSKDPAEVAKAFQTIYKRSPLEWPNLMQVDPGLELIGNVTKEWKWKTTKHIFFIGALKFSETEPSFNVSTARSPSAFSVISMPWNCTSLLTSGQLRRSKGFPKFALKYEVKAQSKNALFTTDGPSRLPTTAEHCFVIIIIIVLTVHDDSIN